MALVVNKMALGHVFLHSIIGPYLCSETIRDHSASKTEPYHTASEW